ncbi:MAG: Trm112 family protein, partial [Candidatus Puniceispirillum sp.]
MSRATDMTNDRSTNGDKTMIDPTLLDILVCPVARCPLVYDADKNELVSVQAR